MTSSAAPNGQTPSAADPHESAESDIAIVGMSGRFPGAPDVDALWRRVVAGDDCLTDLDPALLVAAGLDAVVVQDENYVPRCGVLDDVDRFDAAFFGIGPRDAAIMDPQHRVFLECAWEAIESAAHVPERFDGAIGVFAGCGMNTYLIHNLLTNQRLIDDVGWFLLRHTGNDKDFLSTFLSYKLDLRGPSISVQTACSTSLVAIHLAAQSLLSYECDMALAGGSTIEIPHGVGYTYREGEILSPDGRCRAFDSESAGTVLTSGAGVVALRRMDDALEDGDPILGVLKGSAVNNDGARKVSYLAPSVDGHADAVKEALAVAGLSARQIGLVDAHGTGTPVGDPIEFAALTEAFRASTEDTGFCRLTSTKPNIGHLDTAAGVASVIKVVQALRHRQLPPLANFVAPSPLLDLDGSPFTLSGQPADWPGGERRRAGVSSLGVGGTNAHAIIEEAPRMSTPEPSAPEQVLALSGRSEAAVADATHRLADHLTTETVELADVAHTLAVGRRSFEHRRIVTATDSASVAAQLVEPGSRRVDGTALERSPRLVFMFPGGGSQYPGMGASLDSRFAAFHDAVSDGVRRVRAAGGPDLAATMAVGADPEELRRADVSLPAVFVTSVALARQWMAWGATPDALLGHSLGEYVAAHLAGVLTLDDAIAMVVTRSRLMAQASARFPVGMLAISLPAEECEPMLPSEVSLAVVNTSDECVVAGPLVAIEQLAARLEADSVHAALLKLSAAAHSSVLDPILDEFADFVRTVPLSTPNVPYLSNLSGTWITSQEATDPRYWVDHLRGTVRFDRCLDTVMTDGPVVLTELGPGQALSSYARRHSPAPVAAIPALRHPQDSKPDTAHSLQAFGELWVHGLDVDISQFAGSQRRRLRLPTYPFQRERHWIEPGDGTAGARVSGVVSAAAPEPLRRIEEVSDWFWEPTWEPIDDIAPDVGALDWTIVADPDDGLADELLAELRSRGATAHLQHHPVDADHITTDAVCFIGSNESDRSDTESASRRWLTEALATIRHLGASESTTTVFAAVTRGSTNASGTANRPVDAFALGPIRVAPKEYPSLRTALIDLDPAAVAPISTIANELLHPRNDVVALRGDQALLSVMEKRRIEAPGDASTSFVHDGVYMVTGGLGDIGFAFATHLATAYGARLVIVSSTEIPPEAERDRWLGRHGSDDPTSRRIRRLRVLESIAPEVMHVCADASDRDAIRRAFDGAVDRFGAVDGAIHAAGRLRDALIELSTDDDHAVVVGAKAAGAAAIVNEMVERGPGLVVLVSSTSSFLAAQGQAAYVAANAFLDALPGPDGEHTRIVTVNSGAWAGIGMAADAARRLRLGLGTGERIDHAILSERIDARDGTTEFIGRLGVDDDWIVDEHRIENGTAVLPGTGHLELFVAAAQLTTRGVIALGDVVLIDPLVVADDRPVLVKVRLEAAGEHGPRAATIWSDCGHGVRWHLHSQATILDDAATATQIDVTGDFFDDEISQGLLAAHRSSLRLGPRWDSVRSAHRSGDRSRADLVLPAEFADEVGGWFAHPAQVDVALGVAISNGVDESSRVFAPVSIESLTSFARVGSSCVAVTSITEVTSTTITVDIDLVDPDGELLLALRQVTLHDVGDGSALSTIPSSHQKIPPLPAAGHFVELAESKGIRATDAPTVLERVVTSGLARVIVSSVELSSLAPRDDLNIEVDADATDTTPVEQEGLEAALQSMWRDLLGVNAEPGQNFFDLGGHSLIAIRLIARIHRELGVKLQIAVLFDAPTIAELADLLRAQRPDLETPSRAESAAGDERRPAEPSGRGAPRTFISLNQRGAGTPLTIVHGAGGNIFFLSRLAALMRDHRPLNGIQAVGIDHGDAPDASIEEMAERYVDALSSKSDGPHLLGGFSGGGIIALEMSRQLQAIDHEVRGVVLFDSVPAGTIELPRWTSRRNVVQNMVRHGWGPTSSYLKNRFGSRLIRLLSADEDVGDEQVSWLAELGEEGVVDLSAHFARVSLDYHMPTYDVDAILVKADLMWPYQPHDYHWSPHIDGSLTTITAPGDHETMFDHPNIETVWERLSPLLDRHDA